MDTLKRLQRLTGGAKPGSPRDQAGETLSDLRKRIDEVIERRPERGPRGAAAVCSLADAVPDGGEMDTACGRLFAVHRTHGGTCGAGAFHGRRRITGVRRPEMASAAMMAGQSAIGGFDLGDALFLDTETTGLAGGTGTLAFLVGLGWYEGETFVTRQFFARDFGEEPALLAALGELALQKRFLVTFNGRAFDINLLSARYILNRMHDTVSGMPHLDLLHPARRLLGHRLENSRLVTIEEIVLGYAREGDVPGSEIPQRYFDWLRTRDARLIVDILEHNRLDVIAMAALLAHLCELIEYGTEAEGVEPADVLAASLLCRERGDSAQAMRMLDSLKESNDCFCRREARAHLSLMYKREGDWSRAVALWEEMAEDPSDGFAMVELAKWLEHRVRDFEGAADLVSQALAICGNPEERERLAYRLNRIERRLRKKGLTEPASL